ncbi:MAG TPA: DUF4157 domain-containing protein [Pyrinomonadaceae bacterium]|nr:DUF4157 domain-containing protein [Pyrinomonadaceae bacterium]
MSVPAKSMKDEGSLALRERQQNRKRTAPVGSESQILALQQNVGNQAVGNLLQCGGDVAKLMSANLNISQPGDRSEREAEQTASALLSSRDTNAPGQLSESIGAQSSDRQSLPVTTRARFEPRLGLDLSQVRLHTDARAASSARALNAKAYTLGSNIVFGQGQYAPDTEAGQQVLAHELSHVAQQSHGRIPTDLVQRDEVPLPPIPKSIDVKFVDLPEGVVVSDPTGAKHGITLMRRGDDLFYRLPPPNNQQKSVPRPLDFDSKPPKRETIDSISWRGGGVFQTAFEVNFSSAGSDPYSVNIFGMGRLQTLAAAFLREPAELETRPEGLELERAPGILSQARPKGAAFNKAQRYHMPGATFSMYLFANRRLQVFDDKTGERLWAGVEGTDLRDLRISPAGDVQVSWDDPGSSKGSFSVTFDLRGPRFSPQGLGALGVSAERTTLLSNLKALKVKVVERGSRFTEVELQAALDVLGRWQGAKSVVDSLKANGVPGLTLAKDVLLPSAGNYDDKTGQVNIPGGVEFPAAEERNVVIHEVTHALFQAKGLYPPKGKPPEHIRAVAADMREDSELDLIEEGHVTGGRIRKRRTQEEWEKALSSNEQLNKIWQSLHDRFPISDPEGTADIRGLDVADESRYLGGVRGDPLGHGFDNVNEFIASFVASSLRFQDQMTETVKRSGSELLAILYRKLWTLVNANIVTLGSKNPYADI